MPSQAAESKQSRRQMRASALGPMKHRPETPTQGPSCGAPGLVSANHNAQHIPTVEPQWTQWCPRFSLSANHPLGVLSRRRSAGHEPPSALSVFFHGPTPPPKPQSHPPKPKPHNPQGNRGNRSKFYRFLQQLAIYGQQLDKDGKLEKKTHRKTRNQLSI